MQRFRHTLSILQDIEIQYDEGTKILRYYLYDYEPEESFLEMGEYRRGEEARCEISQFMAEKYLRPYLRNTGTVVALLDPNNALRKFAELYQANTRKKKK